MQQIKAKLRKDVKYMDNSLKGLILAAGVIITCIVVGLGFFISREAKNATNNGTNQLTVLSEEYGDIQFMMYDGLKVSGREVVDVIRKYADNSFKVLVGTKASGSTQIIYSDKNKELPPKGDDDYINPTGLFAGKLNKDENNSLKGITFIQE